MAGLFEAGGGKPGIVEARIMPLQDMPDVFPRIVELEGEEQCLRLEVAGLENKQHPACQVVVAVGCGAFLWRESEEMDALLMVEAGPPVQILDLLVFQDFQPVLVPAGHGVIFQSRRR